MAKNYLQYSHKIVQFRPARIWATNTAYGHLGEEWREEAESLVAALKEN
jgi:hypothetical protein